MTGDLGEAGTHKDEESGGSAPASEDGEDSDSSGSTTGEHWVDEEEATSDSLSDTGESDTIVDPPFCAEDPASVSDLHVGDALDLVHDETHVYFSDRDRDLTGQYAGNGLIGRISKATDDVELLVTMEQQPGSLVLDDTHVYWFNYVARSIRRVAKAGGPDETVREVSTDWTELAIAGDWIYYTLDIGSGGLTRATKDGSEQEVVDPYDYDFQAPLASDGMHVYYVADGELRRHDPALAPGEGIEVLAELNGVESIAVGDDAVYLANMSGAYAVAKIGGVPVQISESYVETHSLAAAGDVAYWGSTLIGVESGCGGGLFRAGLAHAQEVLVSTSSTVFPFEIVVDGSRVYYSDVGRVRRIDP